MQDVRTLPVGENDEVTVTLDELAREGARRMIAAALEAEVEQYVAAFVEEVDEDAKRLVVRNGHARERGLTVGSGTMRLRAPRVNDKRVDETTGQRKRFASAILPAWARKSPQVAEVLPLLYLHGLSSSDFAPGVGAVPRLWCGSVAGDDHPAHHPVARRGRRVQQAVAGRHRLRLLLGGRDRAPRGAV